MKASLNGLAALHKAAKATGSFSDAMSRTKKCLRIPLADSSTTASEHGEQTASSGSLRGSMTARAVCSFKEALQRWETMNQKINTILEDNEDVHIERRLMISRRAARNSFKTEIKKAKLGHPAFIKKMPKVKLYHRKIKLIRKFES